MSGNKTGTGSGQGQANSEEEALAAIIGRVVDERLAPFQAALGQKATSNMAGVPGDDTGRAPITGRAASEGTGIDVGRLVVCAYQEKSGHARGKSAAQIARAAGYERVAKSLEMSDARVQATLAAKALNSTTLEAGGIFVDTPISDEIFTLLQPKVWIRERADSIPLAAGVDFNKQTGEGVAYYKGELDSITGSQPAFGLEAMVERELTALTPFSNRLLQLGGSKVEAMVRDSILRVIAKKENLSFYRGEGTRGGPKGIRNRVASANRFDATQAGATATLAEVRADLQRIMLKLANADVPMAKPAWFMSPSTKAFLMALTDGNGNAVYEAQLSNNTLLGYPVDVSTQVPINLGAGANETELGFVDYGEVIIGQGDMFLEVFPNATYEMGGNTISGVSRNQTVVRAIQYHDLITRHDVSAAFMQCKWLA
ncbi:phage major capsid protein [Myxococcus virescens]|uniref:Phage major capsid protein, HK97 family n=1 Tax=Myxococcus virescens TaxID=83456 RepID=A0A511HNN2_9BACT|nr:phage major capsid protein [Myxococcus virescens]GEL75202.1 hypothetical protein MVI01_69860 [Myxococcus virescens]SDD65133.1 phage major capsid protein, HK97 family [Myxococcus virescens]